MPAKFKAIAASWLIFAFTVPSARTGFSQSMPDSMSKKVDSLFRKWDKPNTPGCVVGIIRNDSLLYAKGYGLANLEAGIPNTPQSIYYMCSLVKQFTGYALVLLARQQKLNLDDDIRLYLPWMADFGHPITIRNLLNHTSGIRDEGDMADISGFPPDGILTQTFALDMLRRQRTLNFVPGEKYSYSNSNYILLAEIVRTVSGQSFSRFMDSAIFKPLGMTASRIIEDGRDIIKGRADSYSSGKTHDFRNSYKVVYVLGAGGLYTNMDDMAHWVMNFYRPAAGDLKDISALTTQGKLNNGATIDYALGISVDSSRGWKRLSHFGGMAGYRTVIYVYPDLHMGFLVFGNSGDDATWNKIDALEALFVPDISPRRPAPPAPPTPPAPPVDSTTSILRDPASITPFAGDYISDNGGQIKFSIVNNRLWVNDKHLMGLVKGATYIPFINPALACTFHIGNGDTAVDMAHPGSTPPTHFIKVTKGIQLPDNELAAYTGTYYSPELDCTYHIILKGHQLFFTNHLHDDAKITLMGREDLVSDYDFLYHVKLLRAKDRKIIGFEVNSDATMHLRFNKIHDWP